MPYFPSNRIRHCSYILPKFSNPLGLGIGKVCPGRDKWFKYLHFLFVNCSVGFTWIFVALGSLPKMTHSIMKHNRNEEIHVLPQLYFEHEF